MAGITFPCPGVCGGVAGVRIPPLNLYCSVCGGSGKTTVYNQRESEAADWDKPQAARKLRGEKAQAKRAAAREADHGFVEEVE